MISCSAALRPCRSAYMPSTMPPTGRMKKPTPNVAMVSSSEAYSLSRRKEQPRDDDGQETVDDEVVPLERVADDGGGDLLVAGGGHGRRLGVDEGWEHLWSIRRRASSEIREASAQPCAWARHRWPGASCASICRRSFTASRVSSAATSPSARLAGGHGLEHLPAVCEAQRQAPTFERGFRRHEPADDRVAAFAVQHFAGLEVASSPSRPRPRASPWRSRSARRAGPPRRRRCRPRGRSGASACTGRRSGPDGSVFTPYSAKQRRMYSVSPSNDHEHAEADVVGNRAFRPVAATRSPRPGPCDAGRRLRCCGRISAGISSTRRPDTAGPPAPASGRWRCTPRCSRSPASSRRGRN